MDIKLFFLIILLVFLYYFPLNSILDLKESFKNELFKNNIKEDFTYQRCKEKPLGRIMGSLFNQFNIEILCTTESPLDDLKWHKQIIESEGSGVVMARSN